MNTNEIKKLDEKYYMNTFGERIPVSFKYGKGINLYSEDGDVYKDFLAGIAVSALGHNNKTLVKAIKKQAKKVLHVSNYYYIEEQARLAENICKNSVADKIFLANSGAEANEGAIKLARIYQYKKGYSEKYEIITLVNSFHGRTLTTVSATGQEKFQTPFKPLTPGFVHVPINDFDALLSAVTDKTCAVMLEMIQGESGVNPLDKEYVKKIYELCKEKDILFICDEVQTGMGRTGKLFAYEHYGIEPDIFTLAKALGGGVPIGAVCAKDNVAKAFQPSDHGSTFGGNPLACASANAVFEVFEKDQLVKNSEVVGLYLKEKLIALKEKCPKIKEVRGTGLMLGVELKDGNAMHIKHELFNNKYLVGATATTIRLLPPLIITKKDADEFIEVFKKVLGEGNNE